MLTVRYRLTGDPKWQDKGWQMFVAWTNAAKVPGGVSSIEDVTKVQIKHTDNMESFAFAETVKWVLRLAFLGPSFLSVLMSRG